MSTCRAIVFDEADAEAIAARLVADGFSATVVRERLAGEDDDEDHPWAVVTDAPELVVEVLVERHDGWLDVAEPTPPTSGPAPSSAPALPLPTAPVTSRRREHGA